MTDLEKKIEQNLVKLQELYQKEEFFTVLLVELEINRLVFTQTQEKIDKLNKKLDKIIKNQEKNSFWKKIFKK